MRSDDTKGLIRDLVTAINSNNRPEAIGCSNAIACRILCDQPAVAEGENLRVIASCLHKLMCHNYSGTDWRTKQFCDL